VSDSLEREPSAGNIYVERFRGPKVGVLIVAHFVPSVDMNEARPFMALDTRAFVERDHLKTEQKKQIKNDQVKALGDRVNRFGGIVEEQLPKAVGHYAALAAQMGYKITSMGDTSFSFPGAGSTLTQAGRRIPDTFYWPQSVLRNLRFS
jgi:hypothetical protein